MLYGKEGIKMSATRAKRIYKYRLDLGDCDSRTGFVYALNYDEAMEHITNYYNNTKIKKVSIELRNFNIIELGAKGNETICS